MEFHKSNVEDAINRAKTNISPLVVFVKGKDALSAKYALLLGEQKELGNKIYVAVTIEPEGILFQQLSVIYGPITIPTLLVLDSATGNELMRKFEPVSNFTDMLDILRDIPCKPESTKYLDDNYQSDKISNYIDSSVLQRKSSELNDNYAKPTREDVIIQSTANDESTSAPKRRKLETEPQESNSSGNGIAMIKLVMKGRETQVLHMKATDTLDKIREIAMKLAKDTSFDLTVPFPKRFLTPEQDSETLRSLELVPSATLMIVPSVGGDASNYLQRFVMNVFLFFCRIWTRIFPTQPNVADT